MTFPSQFMLVAAMNPAPNGKMPGESRCSPREIQNYLGRISAPLLDRIDLHVEVPAVKLREITAERTGEASAQIRERVAPAAARAIQGGSTIARSTGSCGPDRPHGGLGKEFFG
jgi:magnesium chelatase family protein